MTGKYAFRRSATDLARFVLELQRSLHAAANHIVDEDMAAKMVTPIKEDYDLGVVTAGSKQHPRLWHDGVDEGFRAQYVRYRDIREGAIVMTNAKGDGADQITTEVLRSLAVVYAWSDCLPKSILVSH
jgi:hypothetical protein